MVYVTASWKVADVDFGWSWLLVSFFLRMFSSVKDPCFIHRGRRGGEGESRSLGKGKERFVRRSEVGMEIVVE